MADKDEGRNVSKYGEQVPDREIEDTQKSSSSIYDEEATVNGWDPSNRVDATAKMSLKAVKALNPFREDEVYIAEKQVEKARQEILNAPRTEVACLMTGNIILSLGGIFLLFFSLSEPPSNKYAYLIVSACFLIPMISNYFFKFSRDLKRAKKKFIFANRVAAFGAAYHHSPYNLIMSEEDWGAMKTTGRVELKDTHGNVYMVIANHNIYQEMCHTIFRK